ncbi:hypothetical protein [Pendulispora albinea]|uniref:Uncharacterized protein n=1 Tax=Pendulispora albinea TaxID=2741071 RepID=A0ABZ2M8M5_9BACT
MFHPNVAGCFYNDRGQRSAKNFCAKKCESDSDCRSDYRCSDPKEQPLSAIVLDDNQNVRVCVPVPRLTQDASAPPLPDGGSQPLVCLPGSKTNPSEIDGSVAPPNPPDAGASDAGDAGEAGAPSTPAKSSNPGPTSQAGPVSSKSRASGA